MGTCIPSNNYLSLTKQLPINSILENIYNQIAPIKKHPLFKSENINFELEFRLRNKYINIDVSDFVKTGCCTYDEYTYHDSKTTKHRIICNSEYPYSPNEEQDTSTSDGDDDARIADSSQLHEYITNNAEKEITDSLNRKVEYTKKLTLMTAYYFIYKIVLSIETSLDASNIILYLQHSASKATPDNNPTEHIKELDILQYIPPITKHRKLHGDIRIDITKFEDKNQLEIDFSKNIDHERSDMINVVHDIMRTLDCSKFVLDYLFYLLPNFEFQKPITPSLDIIFDRAADLVKNTFFVASKIDGMRRLVIITNQIVFSISESFEVEYINSINSCLHLVLDCEYIDGCFVPFDVLYNDEDLRRRSYKERIAVLEALNMQTAKVSHFWEQGNGMFAKKNIVQCSNVSDLQSFLASETDGKQNAFPNDGIVITDGASSYFESMKVYKIKTMNTVDLRFDGRYFYAKQHRVKKTSLRLSLSEFKRICLEYNHYKKTARSGNNTNNGYYRKQVEIIGSAPFNQRIVRYQLTQVKKRPFIIELNMDTKEFVKERTDKWTSNSMNTFNSIALASLQKINVELFSPSSNLLMRKYHNIIKQNIFSQYKGSLLDIGSGNGGDLYKWRNYRRVVCVEPDPEKIKNFKERIKTSEIKNRIVIHQNNIQNIDIDETFDVATCFFALNDFNYSDVEDMLRNIGKNIQGMFIVLFFDYGLFKDDIDSPCVKYRQCIDPRTNKFRNNPDKGSPTYLIGSLRYAHSECNNIMYVDISGSNVTNHYENAIESSRIIEIFRRFNFALTEQYTIDQFPFCNLSQNMYTSTLRVIKFTNIHTA